MLMSLASARQWALRLQRCEVIPFWGCCRQGRSSVFNGWKPSFFAHWGRSLRRTIPREARLWRNCRSNEHSSAAAVRSLVSPISFGSAFDLSPTKGERKHRSGRGRYHRAFRGMRSLAWRWLVKAVVLCGHRFSFVMWLQVVAAMWVNTVIWHRLASNNLVVHLRHIEFLYPPFWFRAKCVTLMLLCSAAFYCFPHSTIRSFRTLPLLKQ